MSNRRPWFSFLVHPRNVHDLDTIRAAAFLRNYTNTETEYVEKACMLPPLVLGDVTFHGATIFGEIICAVRMPSQILGEYGVSEVIEAAKLAADRGTSVIGLGALTAPVTGGGLLLRKHIPKYVSITTGNGYTAAVAASNVQEATKWMGRGSRARVAVLGATGSVGSAVSWLLADEGYNLTLIGRNRDRTEHLLKGLAGRVHFSDSLRSLSDMDVVLSLTNHASAKLDPGVLRPGSVVVDVAQPKNIESKRIACFHARGVAVADGALVRIPGYRCAQDFSLPSSHDTFACLAETYLLAREGLQVDSLGRANVEHAKLVSELADRFGLMPRTIVPELEASILSGAEHAQPRPTSGTATRTDRHCCIGG